MALLRSAKPFPFHRQNVSTAAHTHPSDLSAKLQSAELFDTVPASAPKMSGCHVTCAYISPRLVDRCVEIYGLVKYQSRSSSSICNNGARVTILGLPES
ncbi:hypothetical protein J6590_025061 [Homalodisca vitripennis]|nr:hypothetical protein J6590_025061 [Homalodisca vitripennis]